MKKLKALTLKPVSELTIGDMKAIVGGSGSKCADEQTLFYCDITIEGADYSGYVCASSSIAAAHNAVSEHLPGFGDPYPSNEAECTAVT